MAEETKAVDQSTDITPVETVVERPVPEPDGVDPMVQAFGIPFQAEKRLESVSQSEEALDPGDLYVQRPKEKLGLTFSEKIWYMDYQAVKKKLFEIVVPFKGPVSSMIDEYKTISKSYEEATSSDRSIINNVLNETYRGSLVSQAAANHAQIFTAGMPPEVMEAISSRRISEREGSLFATPAEKMYNFVDTTTMLGFSFMRDYLLSKVFIRANLLTGAATGVTPVLTQTMAFNLAQSTNDGITMYNTANNIKNLTGEDKMSPELAGGIGFLSSFFSARITNAAFNSVLPNYIGRLSELNPTNMVTKALARNASKLGEKAWFGMEGVADRVTDVSTRNFLYEQMNLPELKESYTGFQLGMAFFIPFALHSAKNQHMFRTEEGKAKFAEKMHDRLGAAKGIGDDDSFFKDLPEADRKARVNSLYNVFAKGLDKEIPIDAGLDATLKVVLAGDSTSVGDIHQVARSINEVDFRDDFRRAARLDIESYYLRKKEASLKEEGTILSEKEIQRSVRDDLGSKGDIRSYFEMMYDKHDFSSEGTASAIDIDVRKTLLEDFYAQDALSEAMRSGWAKASNAMPNDTKADVVAKAAKEAEAEFKTIMHEHWNYVAADGMQRMVSEMYGRVKTTDDVDIDAIAPNQRMADDVFNKSMAPYAAATKKMIKIRKKANAELEAKIDSDIKGWGKIGRAIDKVETDLESLKPYDITKNLANNTYDILNYLHDVSFDNYSRKIVADVTDSFRESVVISHFLQNKGKKFIADMDATITELKLDEHKIKKYVDSIYDEDNFGRPRQYGDIVGDLDKMTADIKQASEWGLNKKELEVAHKLANFVTRANNLVTNAQKGLITDDMLHKADWSFAGENYNLTDKTSAWIPVAWNDIGKSKLSSDWLAENEGYINHYMPRAYGSMRFETDHRLPLVNELDYHINYLANYGLVKNSLEGGIKKMTPLFADIRTIYSQEARGKSEVPVKMNNMEDIFMANKGSKPVEYLYRLDNNMKDLFKVGKKYNDASMIVSGLAFIPRGLAFSSGAMTRLLLSDFNLPYHIFNLMPTRQTGVDIGGHRATMYASAKSFGLAYDFLVKYKKDFSKMYVDLEKSGADNKVKADYLVGKVMQKIYPMDAFESHMRSFSGGIGSNMIVKGTEYSDPNLSQKATQAVRYVAYGISKALDKISVLGATSDINGRGGSCYGAYFMVDQTFKRNLWEPSNQLHAAERVNMIERDLGINNVFSGVDKYRLQQKLYSSLSEFDKTKNKDALDPFYEEYMERYTRKTNLDHDFAATPNVIQKMKNFSPLTGAVSQLGSFEIKSRSNTYRQITSPFRSDLRPFMRLFTMIGGHLLLHAATERYAPETSFEKLHNTYGVARLPVLGAYSGVMQRADRPLGVVSKTAETYAAGFAMIGNTLTGNYAEAEDNFLYLYKTFGPQYRAKIPFMQGLDLFDPKSEKIDFKQIESDYKKTAQMFSGMLNIFRGVSHEFRDSSVGMELDLLTKSIEKIRLESIESLTNMQEIEESAIKAAEDIENIETK